MREVFQKIWDDVLFTSDNPNCRAFGLIGLAHVLLGSTLAFLAPTVWIGLIIVAVFFVLREMSDVRGGGSYIDSCIFAGLFAVGLLTYTGPPAWPALMFLVVGIVTYALYWVRARFISFGTSKTQ